MFGCTGYNIRNIHVCLQPEEHVRIPPAHAKVAEVVDCGLTTRSRCCNCVAVRVRVQFAENKLGDRRDSMSKSAAKH